jgi:hypothetical protein
MAGRAKEVDKKETLKDGLAKIYTPGAPIEDPDLFSGRKDLLARLADGLGETGKHFVLYGESSVGKSSLWQVLLANKRVCRHSASSSDDFASILLPVLESIEEQFTADGRQRTISGEFSASVPSAVSAKVGESVGSTDATVGKRTVDLNFVRERISKHQKEIDAIVIDQFQKIESTGVQGELIELAKALSDNGVRVRLFFVGVADSDEHLIASPEYREAKDRHFIVKRVPRMNDEEIRDILDRRRKLFKVELEAEVKSAIVEISSGYPSVAHRLALASSQNWVMRAFTGFAMNLITNLLGILGGFGPTGEIAVKKAGVHVEHDDLRASVERFVADFDENHATAAAGYEEVCGGRSREDFERALDAVASSPAARLDASALGDQLEITSSELSSLIGSGCGLLQKAADGYELTVREVRPYMRARRYLEASSPVGAA